MPLAVFNRAKPCSTVRRLPLRSRRSKNPPRMSITIQLAGTTAELLPERALWLPGHRVLLLADLHWGKDHAFRAHGIPLPGGLLHNELQRLHDLMQRLAPDHVYLLGDLVHSRAGVTPEVIDDVACWRSQTTTPMTLVRGNHDRHLPSLPAAWHMHDSADPIALGPFLLVHDPAEMVQTNSAIHSADNRAENSTGNFTDNYPVNSASQSARNEDPERICHSGNSAISQRYILAGHLHPTVVLRQRGDRLRLPCFHFGPSVGVLPAFSTFTNGVVVQPERGDRVYVIAQQRVVAV